MTVSRPRPPAITDVAAAAGVSYQTVSRVINNNGLVAASTRERVLAAIEELGYHPNGAARALATGRGSTLAVFSGNTKLYGYASALEGIEEAAREAGLTVSITVLAALSDADAAAVASRALTQPLAGVVAMAYDKPGIQAAQLIPPDLPAVAVGGQARKAIKCVHAVMDERGGAVAATRHLLELGHHTVHHVAIPHAGPLSRTVGWRHVLRAERRPVPPVIHCDWHPRSGYEAGLALADNDDVTAVLCGNDELAIGIMRAFHDRGKRVPEDVSVIGFDDEPLAEFVRPALTTVRQDFTVLGRTAVGLLRDQLDGRPRPARAQLLATELVIRESAAAPPKIRRR